MTYTAADEDGDEAAFGFTITVDPAPQLARSTSEVATLSVDTASFSEDAGEINVTLTATRYTDAANTTVNLSLAGTATSGTDYTGSLPASVTVHSGFTRNTVALTFTLVDDAVLEGSETIVISGTSHGSVGSAVITIVDNEDTSGLKPGTPTVTRTEFSQQSAPDWT